MRKTFILLSLALLTSNAFADRFQDTVYSVSKGKKKENHLIFMESGRVVHVKNNDIPLDEFIPGDAVEVKTNEQNEVEAVSSVPDQRPLEDERNHEYVTSEKATVLPSYQAALSIFSGMNRSYKSRTECTDRAHVWTYEEWKKSGLISRKVFLFFTNTYIRRYNYGWWFHVSPYTLVGSDSTEYVMDRRYTSTPRLMKSWTDIFIRSKRTCPVSTYRHYRGNKNGAEHCFIVKSSMYNRLPYHVRMEEDYGRVQTRFSTSEVNFSYRAFNRRGAKARASSYSSFLK